MSHIDTDKIKEAWDKYMIMRFTHGEAIDVKLLGVDERELNNLDNMG